MWVGLAHEVARCGRREDSTSCPFLFGGVEEAMERRSFLQLLALLPGLGWLASPSEAVAVEVPVEPPSLSLQEIFDDIRKFVAEHPGATVLAADNPELLRIGWVAFKNYGPERVERVDGRYVITEAYEISKHWEIPLYRVKQEVASRAHPMCTVPGRREIAQRLQDGLYFEW